MAITAALGNALAGLANGTSIWTSSALAARPEAPVSDGGDIPPGDIMVGLYHHLSPTPYTDEPLFSIGGYDVQFYNHHVAILVALGLCFLVFGWLAGRRKAELAPKGALQNLLEAMVLFVRDDMVYGTMGKSIGRRFMPLFLTQFFAILFMNLMGILPNFDIGHNLLLPTTATANIAVTAGLALTTFAVMIIAGIKEQGFGPFVVNLAPAVDLGPGAVNGAIKKVVLAVLYPIEILGLIIKPMALCIRLFANMTGGHMALLTIYGLVFVAGQALPPAASYPIAIVSISFNVALTFLEIFVACLQAYIFTYLSIIFVNASVHPEH